MLNRICLNKLWLFSKNNSNQLCRYEWLEYYYRVFCFFGIFYSLLCFTRYLRTQSKLAQISQNKLWTIAALITFNLKHVVINMKAEIKHGLFKYMKQSTKSMRRSVYLCTDVTHSWPRMAADELQSVSWQTKQDLHHTDGISTLPFIYTHSHTHTCKQTH